MPVSPRVSAVSRAAVTTTLIASLMLTAAVGLANERGERVTAIASPDRVAISGSTVVYSDVSEAGNWDVFVHDLDSDGPVSITGAGDQMLPDVDGDIVVFVDFSNGDADIRGYDLIERRTFDICIERGSQTQPGISGDWVIWVEQGAGQLGSLHALNIRTGEQARIADSKATAAHIAGTLVVYEDHSAGAPSVMAFDLSTHTAEKIAPSAGAQLMPSTDGEWIAWTQADGDGYQVAAKRFGTTGSVVVAREGEQTTPLVDDGTLTLIERVAGSAMRVVSIALPDGDAVELPSGGDVVSVATDAGRLAWIERDIDGEWALRTTASGRGAWGSVATAVRSAWRRIVPARYVAWATDGSTIAAGGVTRVGFVERPQRLQLSVVDAESVRLTWEKPYTVDGLKNYDVYRHYRPISAANLTSATKLASEITTTTYYVTVPTSTETTVHAMSYYYAVVARDNADAVSPVSANVTPNPHGALSYSPVGVDGCFDCHEIHGGASPGANTLGATSVGACYNCHGSTPGTSEYGAGALSDVQAGFGDETTVNVGPLRPDGGSMHRNATMLQQQAECASCHDPHRRQYYVDGSGNYVAAQSSAKLLRSHTATTPADAYDSWVDTDPAGNRICFSCHGSSVTPMTIAGGAAAYSRTAGNHQSSGGRTYDGSAHGPGSVPAVGSTAQVQCLVCHNQHSSATARLIDYRQSGTSDASANRQANLCFRCHNVTTANTWNARNVQAEFARTSAHPSAATTTAGQPSATCVSCHNTHFVQKGGTSAWDTARVSNPSNTLETVSGATSFCLGCHTTPAADGSIFKNAVATSSQLVPYGIQMRPSNIWPFFGGWGKSASGLEFTNSAHATASVADGRAGCENCHDPHGSDFDNLIAWTRPAGATIAGGLQGARANTTAFADRSREENLCYQCHGDGTATRGKAAGAANVYTPAQGTYKHPISTTGRHSNEEGLDDHGLANRHSECVDCHNPHTARSGVRQANSSTAGEVLRGAVGVKPTWPATNWGTPTGYTPQRIVPGAGDDYEAYLCLKCHIQASATGGGSANFRTNLALEFNPSNLSYHRVLGSSQQPMRTSFTVTPVGGTSTSVTWSLPTIAFKSGYTSSTMLSCTSCHSSQNAGQARGPHGSSAKYMLDPAYPVDWNSTAANLQSSGSGMPAGLICNKCHELRNSSGTWGTVAHAEHDSRGSAGGYCRFCHVGVPHGWKRPRLLGYTTDDAPYATWKTSSGPGTTGSYGLYKLKVKSSTTPNNWQKSDCSASCSSSAHPNLTSGYWP